MEDSAKWDGAVPVSERAGWNHAKWGAAQKRDRADRFDAG